MTDIKEKSVDEIKEELSSLSLLNGNSIFPLNAKTNDLIVILDVNEFSLKEKYSKYNEIASRTPKSKGVFFSIIDKKDIGNIPRILDYIICSWCSNLSILNILNDKGIDFHIQEKDPYKSEVSNSNLRKFLEDTKIRKEMPMFHRSFRGGREQIFTNYSNLENLIDDLGYCSIKRMGNVYKTYKLDRFMHTIEESSADECKIDLHRFIKKFQGDECATEFKNQNWRRIDNDFMKSHTAEIECLEDSKDSSFMFFSNCVLKIKKDSYEKIMLPELEDGVFVRTECKHPLLEKPKDAEISEFYRFFQHICNHDQRREKALKTAIGYLLHRFHSGNPKAIVLVDESIDENTGGTGKGIVWHAIEQIRNLVSIDCRNEGNWTSNFKFSEVKENTSVFVYDEMTTKHWEDIFKTITDGMTVECKYQEKFTIPPEDSPKILIASNYAPMGISSSFVRRRAVYELSNFYSEEKTPLDEFGHWFFSSDWSQEEWSMFYWFMADCLKEYLCSGLVEISSESLEKKKMENIPEKYRDFMEEILRFEGESMFISSKDLKESYFKFYEIDQSERKSFLGTSLEKDLASSIRTFCKIKGLKSESVRKCQTVDGEKIFIRGFLIAKKNE